MVRSVHYCPATKKTMERRYTDMTSLEAFPSSAAYPTKVSLVMFQSFNVYLVESGSLCLYLYSVSRPPDKWAEIQSCRYDGVSG